MTDTTDALPEQPARALAPATAMPWSRVFYWWVRRELWENRAFFIAPLAFGAIALLGVLLSTVYLPHVIRALSVAEDRKAGMAVAAPYAFLAFSVVITGILVAVFYCVGALHNERRDRSILFWKSLPVSDLTTVLSKAFVPLIVLPPILFVIAFVVQVIAVVFSSLVVAAHGLDIQVFWSHTHLLSMWRMLAEGLPYIALWYAPLYAWLILVSAWARRMPVLWAVAPPIVLGLLERLVFNTTYVWRWIALRISGAFSGAFDDVGGRVHHASGLDAGGWLSPHLWIGLIMAAAFLAIAVRLRRSRDPI
jgi:ABC-2 type transport system permease protein